MKNFLQHQFRIWNMCSRPNLLDIWLQLLSLVEIKAQSFQVERSIWESTGSTTLLKCNNTSIMNLFESYSSIMPSTIMRKAGGREKPCPNPDSIGDKRWLGSTYSFICNFMSSSAIFDTDGRIVIDLSNTFTTNQYILSSNVLLTILIKSGNM